MLHPLVTRSKQPLAGFVPFNDGASPATEAGISTGWSAGVNLNWTLTVGGTRVELVERAVVASPWVWFLEQVGPDLLGSKELDWVGHPGARRSG